MLLLSLTGEQPIPNLLPLWQYRRFTATQFAATRTTLPVAQTLAQAIRQDARLKRLEVLDPVLVEAYDIRKARAALAAILSKRQSENREVTLNLTGGTKLMSLAALQAVFGSGVPLLYVSTEINQMIFLASDGSETRRDPIRVKVSVAQYLAAHGLEVFFLPHDPASGGSYLEDQCYRRLLASHQFDDVRRNVHVLRHTETGEVRNELDIVVTRNGRLAVCSCKSGKIDNDDFYELSSLSRREAAGIYCGKLLITDRQDLLPSSYERARAQGVQLVAGNLLDELVDTLLKATT